MNDNKVLLKTNRSEEVSDIIDRMPESMGYKITAFVLAMIIIFFTLGWIIKYPDSVTGKVVLSASSAPVKLVCNFSGKINLNGRKSFSNVKQGDYIAFIENTASINDMKNIIHLLSTFNLKNGDGLENYGSFPKNVSLGEINTVYFRFMNSFSQMTGYRKSNMYEKQIEILKQLLGEYKLMLGVTIKRINISETNISFIQKFERRDSILLGKKVISEADNDKTIISSVSAKDNKNALLKEQYSIQSQIEQARNQIQQIELQNLEKEKELTLNLIDSFSELESALKAWEQKYVFKSPIDGSLQFLEFWDNGQFIEAGKAVFSIVPIKTNVVAQMTLPALGAGKVKIGQNVIIKLDNYPFAEYGSIRGRVSSVSLIANSIETKDGIFDTYLANIELPNKLRTNYGSELDFKFEIKGTGDIITHERRLLLRLFDDLKYAASQ